MGYLFIFLFFVAMVLVVVGKIMFIVAAFRTSAVWGICVLFLQGIADFLFLIMHWEDAKKAFGIQILGILIGFAAIFSGMGNAGSAMQGLTEALAESGMSEEQVAALQKLADENFAAASKTEKAKPSKPLKLFGKDPKSFQGETLEKVREELGRPKGQMKSGEEICLLYDRFTVFSTDGETVSHVEIGEGQRPSRAGRAPRRKRASPASTGTQRGPAVRMIANGGKRIDMKQVLVPGKITVVDFYADWCGPCKRIGPQLEQIARSDPDVVLCKVDIVNWSTPVVKQFGIRSIPNIRVFDRNGAAIGSPTAGLGEAKRNIERAR